MILFLYGQDTFRSHAQLVRMIQKFKKDRDPHGYNVTEIDANDTENGVIMTELLAAPFLAERRMVVVKKLLSAKQSQTRERLLARLKEGALPETTVAVFWEETDSFKAKDAQVLFDRLRKEKFAQCFDLLTGAALGQWISAEVAERGGVVEPQAVRYLVEQTGKDMWRLNGILDQMIAFGRGTRLTQAEAALFCGEAMDDNVFALAEAVVQGQSSVSYAMVRDRYRRGDDVLYLVSMIARQVRILLQIHDLMKRTDMRSSDALAPALKLHPFVVKKSLSVVRRFRWEDLCRSHEALLRLEADIKSGGGRPEMLLDVYIARLGQSASV